MGNEVIIFGQGNEQPEFSWLDKITFEFIEKCKRDTDRLFHRYDRETKDYMTEQAKKVPTCSTGMYLIDTGNPETEGKFIPYDLETMKAMQELKYGNKAKND